ncbi:hypothetical protein FQZ97_1112070 [compost metagenome]
MHHQNGDRDAFKVFGEVGLGEGDDAVVMSLRAAHHALPPPVPDDALRRLRSRAVVAVEGTRRNIVIKLRAIGRQLSLQIVEDVFGETARVVRGLHHQWWNRADDDRLGNRILTMPRDVVDDLATAGGVACMDGS